MRINLLFALALSMGTLSVDLFAMDQPFKPQGTKNGFGLNFDSLGELEEQILKECELKAAKPHSNFLFLAAAYGRLPMRVVTELKGEAKIVVNELSPENIADFMADINKMAAQSEGQPSINAKNVTTIVGDCLSLSHSLSSEFGSFDVIVADNLLHFFNGEQILSFLITYYNLLKPDGKLFLLFEGRAQSFSREKLLEMKSTAALYVNTIHEISSLAEGYDNKILFPGLICDAWLKDKHEMLGFLIREKPNSFTQQNHIHYESIQKIAKALGFNIDATDFYAKIQVGSGLGFYKVESEIDSVGMILSRPAKTEHELPKTKAALDTELVCSCDNAAQIMKDFIDGPGNLSIITPCPYITKGPNFCNSASCRKKGISFCAQCKVAKYCSRECQVADWKNGHKNNCKK